MEVGPEGLGPVHVGSAGDMNRLDHLQPRPPGDLAAQLRPLGPVQLHHRQPGVLDRLVDFVQLRIDEDPDDLALAPEGRPDPGRLTRLHVARAAVEMDQPNRPGAEQNGLRRVVEIGDSTELDPHEPQGT